MPCWGKLMLEKLNITQVEGEVEVKVIKQVEVATSMYMERLIVEAILLAGVRQER